MSELLESILKYAESINARVCLMEETLQELQTTLESMAAREPQPHQHPYISSGKLWIESQD